MERMFTRDVGKNFKKGETKDFILETWESIAKTEGAPLDDFSCTLEEIALRGLGKGDKPLKRVSRSKN